MFGYNADYGGRPAHPQTVPAMRVGVESGSSYTRQRRTKTKSSGNPSVLPPSKGARKMPELPEAETIARQLGLRLTGRKLGKVRHVRRDMVHGDPRPLSKVVTGRRVVAVRRRAKRVILDLAGGVELIFRLGMSGSMTIGRSRDPVEAHTHLRVEVRGTDTELRFRDPRRFGGIWCLAGGTRHVGKKLGPVGPEPLETTAPQFRRLLQRHRQIKALLMDQAVIAGLGNIYCDESLHGAAIHPLTPADELDAKGAGRLLRAIKTTLNRAIRANGSTLMNYRTAEGERGSFQDQHRVYQREGEHCRRCGTSIERIIAAGRSTFFCPRCQPRLIDA